MQRQKICDKFFSLNWCYVSSNGVSSDTNREVW